MNTVAGLARTPFLLTVTARACRCNQAPKELGRAQKYERALSKMEGYWNVYLGFFGDQIVWLNFQIIDLRDGRVCWRNGRSTSEEAKTLGTHES